MQLVLLIRSRTASLKASSTAQVFPSCQQVVVLSL